MRSEVITKQYEVQCDSCKSTTTSETKFPKGWFMIETRIKNGTFLIEREGNEDIDMVHLQGRTRHAFCSDQCFQDQFILWAQLYMAGYKRIKPPSKHQPFQ